MFRRRRDATPIDLLRLGRRPRVSNDVRDMSGYTEATLLKRNERRERDRHPDRMVERERWDLLG
jgi:hypothetical protein